MTLFIIPITALAIAIFIIMALTLQIQEVNARQFGVNWQTNVTYPTERLFYIAKQPFDANILCGNSRDDVINNIDKNIAALPLNKDYLKSSEYINKLNTFADKSEAQCEK